MTEKLMVEQGQVFKDGEIRLLVLEAKPFRDPSNRASFMVGLRILDGDYQSPVFHIWMKKKNDIRTAVSKIIGDYRQTLSQIGSYTPVLEKKIEVIQPIEEPQKVEVIKHEPPPPHPGVVRGYIRVGVRRIIEKNTPIARELLKEAKKINRFALMGRRPSSLEAAALYIVGFLTNKILTQNEIAEFFGITDVTIRNNYHHLVKVLKLEHDRPYPSSLQRPHPNYLQGFNNYTDLLEGLRKRREAALKQSHKRRLRKDDRV